MSTTTELPAHIASALTPYDPIRAELAKLESDNAALVFDYESPKGEKAARSHIYSLRKKRADVDRVRKALKADALEFGRRVDSVARELTGRIDAMIDVHQRPLDEIAEREAQRKSAIERAIQQIRDVRVSVAGGTSEQIAAAIVRLTDMEPTTEVFQERIGEAVDLRQSELAALRTMLAETQRREAEAEAEELERLRREAAEREQREREERIAREAEERARREAEAKAQREREEAERRERELIAEKERAEREAAEREARAKADADRRVREAEQRAQREREEAERAEAKRRADAEHAAKVRREIADAIAEHLPDGIEAVVEAMIAGSVPHVEVRF